MSQFRMSKLLTLVLTAASALLLTANVAHAQIGNKIEAKVPFTFTVGNSTLPAGNYTIRVPNSIEPDVLEISNDQTNVAVVFLTQATQIKQPVKTAELVFNKIGDKDFLSQILLDESNYGYEVEKSRAELKLVKGGAKHQSHRLPIIHHKKSAS